MFKEYNGSLPDGTTLKGVAYNYIIQKVLGQGTFGITYLAKVVMQGALGILNTNMYVAIKEFFMKDICWREGSNVMTGSKVGLYDDYKKKFAKEAINLSKLLHPGIVKVVESFECNRSSYFVMEFIDGENLNEYIQKNGMLSEKESLDCIIKIGQAISFMHENKMLHLDLKPMNIMRRNNGELVLIDFGLSKQFNENGEPESTTSIGGGTTGYAPLEQSTYKKGEGFPATLDVYALGATLYKCLIGKTPPNASTILNEGLPDDAWPVYLNPETIKLVEEAMHPLRKNRIQTVDAFIAKAKDIQTSTTDGINRNNDIANRLFSSKEDTLPGNRPLLDDVQEINGLCVKWKFNTNDYDEESDFTKEGLTRYLQSFKNLGGGVFGSSIPVNQAMRASTHYDWGNPLNNLHGDINFAILQIKYLQKLTGLAFRLPTAHELAYLVFNGGDSNGKYFYYNSDTAELGIRDFSKFDGITSFDRHNLWDMTHNKDCACILVLDSQIDKIEENENTDGIWRSYGIWQFDFCPVTLFPGNNQFGMIDKTGRLVIDYKYDSVSEAGLFCPPGPGLPPIFLGVHCRKGDINSYYRIEPDMKVVEYARMTDAEYELRCQFT